MHPVSTKRIILLLGLCLAAPLASASDGSVKIMSPAEGAKLDAMAQNKVDYEVVPGAQGDHVHLYVDGKEVAILRKLKGSYTMETLAPGKHEICVKVVNRNHTPTGVEQCVRVSAD